MLKIIFSHFLGRFMGPFLPHFSEKMHKMGSSKKYVTLDLAQIFFFIFLQKYSYTLQIFRRVIFFKLKKKNNEG
jgi:hypothetical protein